jgi:hypothetical protein
MRSFTARCAVFLSSYIVCSVLALALSLVATAKAENIRTAMSSAPLGKSLSLSTSYQLVACSSAASRACNRVKEKCWPSSRPERDEADEAARRNCERAQTKCLERCGDRFPGR